MSYALRVVTPPAEEPVSLEEAKAWVRQDVADDDALLRALVKAARVRAEMETGRALVTRTLELSLDFFAGPWDAILLPRPPLRSVVSINYLDQSGEAQVFGAENYQVFADGDFGAVAPVYPAFWPYAAQYLWQPVTIRYEAGYGAAADVPEDLKTAVKLMVAAWYEGRSEAEVPAAACAILRGNWTGQYAPGLALADDGA